MEKKEVNEGNELIAVFMGGKFAKSIDGVDYWAAPDDCPNPHNASMGAFRYHDKWDWIMPVVEKIEKDYHVVIRWHTCDIVNGDRVFQQRGATKIEAVWLTVLDFIKWHNENCKG